MHFIFRNPESTGAPGAYPKRDPQKPPASLAPLTEKEPIMKSTRLHRITIAAIAATASSVWASDMNGPTREQVRAELMEAQRNGTLIANGETGATFRDLNPGNYMAKPATQGLSRADVQAAFEQARANGELIANTEIGLTARQLAPGNYAAPKPMDAPAAQGKTRDEVQAELSRAIANGTTMANGELGLTHRDLNPQVYADQDNTQASQQTDNTSTYLGQHGNPNSNMY